MEYKQNQTSIVPVRLQDSTGAAKTGVLYSDVTITLYKANGTTSNLTMSVDNWAEITDGAFSGTGTYKLTLDATDLNIQGDFLYAVAVANTQPYIGLIKVVAYEEADTYNAITGRWKIEVVGPDANRLVLYDTDNITVLKKYDLKDALGNPSVVNPFERIPV